MRFLLACLIALGSSRAVAYDTLWHNAATAAAGKELGFSGDAINVLQVGNFSVDFYSAPYDGPIAPRLGNKIVVALKSSFQYRTGMIAQMVRRPFTFLHFDNLNGSLVTNAQFGSLWSRVRANTIAAIKQCKLAGQDAVHEKMCVLMTVGASLHFVEDFYSHTDWTHQKFDGIPFRRTTPWDWSRPPTWFEVLAQYPDPNNIPFTVRAGLYPTPASGAPNSHDNLAHDNSDLKMEGEDRAAMHEAGPEPASRSTLKHVQFAVRGSCAADVEWLKMIAEDEEVRAALAAAVRLNLARENKVMLMHLDGATWFTMFFPCAANHMDGKTQKAADLCKGIFPGVLSYGFRGVVAAGGGVLVGHDLWTNQFWKLFQQSFILDALAEGIGIVDSTGVRYDFR